MVGQGIAAKLAAVVLAALAAEGVRGADQRAREGRFPRRLADALWLGMAFHAAIRTRFPPAPRAPFARVAVRAAKIGGTWIYGSFTVTLLDLSLADPARCLLFLRPIAGLG